MTYHNQSVSNGSEVTEGFPQSTRNAIAANEDGIWCSNSCGPST